MEKRLVYAIGFGFVFVCIILAGILLVTSHRYDSPVPESEIRGINISVVKPPVSSADGTGITYEIEMTPFAERELALMKVELVNRDTGDLIKTLEKEELTRSLHEGSDNRTGPRILMDVPFSPGTAQGWYTHRLTFVSEGRAILPFTVTGGEIRIP